MDRIPYGLYTVYAVYRMGIYPMDHIPYGHIPYGLCTVCAYTVCDAYCMWRIPYMPHTVCAPLARPLALLLFMSGSSSGLFRAFRGFRGCSWRAVELFVGWFGAERSREDGDMATAAEAEVGCAVLRCTVPSDNVCLTGSKRGPGKH